MHAEKYPKYQRWGQKMEHLSDYLSKSLLEAGGLQNAHREVLPISKTIRSKASLNHLGLLIQPHFPHSSLICSHVLPRLRHKSASQNFANASGRPFPDSRPSCMLLLYLEGHLSLSHLPKSSWSIFPDMARDCIPWTSFSRKPQLIHRRVPSVLHGTQNLQSRYSFE